VETKNTSFSLIRIIIVLTTTLIPLFFLPITVNFFTTNKQGLFIFATLVSMTLWSLQFFIRKQARITVTQLTGPLFLLFLSTLLSQLFIKQNQVESFVNHGTLLLTLPFWYFLVASISKTKSFVLNMIKAIMIPGVLLALHGLFQLLVLSSLPQIPDWLQGKSFTPAGSPIILFTYLAVSFTITLTLALKQTHSRKRIVLYFFAFIQASALALYFSQMLPGKAFAPALVPLRAGWSLALDALKNPKAFLFGIGYANFPSLYMQVKPAFVNNTLLWNITPQYSSNELIHQLTTGGILGFISLAWLFIASIRFSFSQRKVMSDEHLACSLGLVVLMLSFFLAPASLISYFLLVTLLAIITIIQKYETSSIKVIELRASNDLPLTGLPSLIHKTETPVASFVPHALLGIFGSLSLLFLFFGSKVYAAEVALRQAQKAVALADGKTVYEKYITAIQHVPTITSYHIAYSQINLSLAVNISKRENLTDNDRQQISQFMSQAVREARIATSLDAGNATTWSNLGSIFRNLINVAQGSEQNAIASYSQAVTLDPANPILRVEFGGLFYQLAQMVASTDTSKFTNDQKQQAEQLRINYLQRAITQFQAAIQLKTDYANAYYNLAKALESGQNIAGAYQAMQQVIANLSTESQEYTQVFNELTQLKNKLPADQTQTIPVQEPIQQDEKKKELTEPSPLPSSIPGGLIELPEEENPVEQPQATSQPTPEPTTENQ